MDYDKQYEDDIEKATALSLETLALDQFRRNKLQYSSISDVSTATSILKSTCKNKTWRTLWFFDFTLSFYYFLCSAYNTLAIHRPRPGSNGGSSTTYTSSSLPNSASNGSLAPPPSVPPRNVRSANSSDEPDLISFTAESSLASANALVTDALANNSHSNLLQMVNEMHRQNINTATNSFGFAPAQSGGLQLVPYAGNLNTTASTQQPKMPLTSDQLTKLYSMGTYGRSPSTPLTSFNQFGFPTASVSTPHATSAINAFAPSTFPINSTTSNVAAATSATSYLHQTTSMYAPPSLSTSPFPDPNALYSSSNISSVMHRTQSAGQFYASHLSFGANVMSPTDSSMIASAPKLPPRQSINPVPSNTISDAIQSKPVKKENSNVVHRRTSNVSKQLGDDLIDLDHGIVDK